MGHVNSLVFIYFFDKLAVEIKMRIIQIIVRKYYFNIIDRKIENGV